MTNEEEFGRILREQTDRIDRIENARYREAVPNPIVATTDTSTAADSTTVATQPAASMEFGDPFKISEFPMPGDEGPPVPPQAIHYYPMDEESGSTLTDAVGGADFSLTGATWVSNSRYTGGVAPSFGGDDYAEGSPDLSTPFTLLIRTYTDGLPSSSPGYRTVLCDDSDNGNAVVYDVGNEVWRVNNPRIDIAESDPTGERIIALRSASSGTGFRIYDANGSLTGSISANSGMSFAGQVNLGRWDDFSRYWTGELDALTVYDSFLSNSEISDIINEYY